MSLPSFLKTSSLGLAFRLLLFVPVPALSSRVPGASWVQAEHQRAEPGLSSELSSDPTGVS